jgi:methyl coenzyme M reductase subunit C-like uncharacterized protein (methanogenesis marker protein 7)
MLKIYTSITVDGDDIEALDDLSGLAEKYIASKRGPDDGADSPVVVDHLSVLEVKKVISLINRISSTMNDLMGLE